MRVVGRRNDDRIEPRIVEYLAEIPLPPGGRTDLGEIAQAAVENRFVHVANDRDVRVG